MRILRLMMVMQGVCTAGLCIASDSAVQLFTTKQAYPNGGIIYTFDALQAGFSITSGTITCRTTFPMSGVIDLSTGSAPYAPLSLILGNDLVLNDISTISSIGNITGAGYALVLPKSVTQFPVNTTATNCTFSNLAIVCNGDIAWRAPSITFSGNSLINGRGNTITLAAGTTITVAAGATLSLQDVTIRGVSGTKILCAAATSTVSLNNVTFILEGDYTFGQGRLVIVQDMRIAGAGRTCTYSSGQVSSVFSGATLTVDPGVVLSYASPGATNFQLADSTAQLFLYSSTLRVAAGATSGLALSAGTILVDGLSYIDDPTNKGVVFGSAVQVQFAPAATLQQQSGSMTVN